MRNIMIVGAVAAAAVAAPASAQTITFVNGNYAIPAFTTAAVFEEFEGGTPGVQYNPATQSGGVRPQSVSGTVLAAQGDVPGRNRRPDTDNNEYIAVQAGGAFTVNLAPGVTVFSFVFGTLDSYNSLQLFFSSGPSRTFNGTEIVGLPALTVNPSNTELSGRVTYDTGGANTITSAVFRSNDFSAFEIDALAAAVPEPATWGLMILGFGVIGGQLRSRRRTKATFAIA